MLTIGVPKEDYAEPTDPARFAAVFFNGVPTAEAEEGAKLALSSSIASFYTPMQHDPAELGIPRKYIACEEDRCVPFEHQLKMAASKDFEVVRRFKCGHSPFMLDRETAEIVDLIKGL